MIQKQIQLQKKAFECREREINIYERELLEREKYLNGKADPANILVQATVTAPEPQQHELTVTREPNINIVRNDSHLGMLNLLLSKDFTG